MAEFRGRLYIFVEAPQEGELAASPADPHDVFGRRDAGDILWYRIGWAVSNNVRGTHCARTSDSKLRAFGTFAECMDFVRKKRQSRPWERFYLVYDVDGRKSIVTSLEQIVRLDGDTAHAEHPGAAAGIPDPALNVLTAKVGQIVATNALVLLRMLDRDGETAARAHFSGATYERLWRVLCDAALVGVSAPPSA